MIGTSSRVAVHPSLGELERRLQTLLPEEYRDRYEDVQPTSMGSAGLKYGSDGKVAWDEIWATFCDLAMAGGPPHRGTLLEPASFEEVAAQPIRYQQVVSEICRGVALVSGLDAEPAPTPGWVRVQCKSIATADWLVRAIAMENVAVRTCEGATVDLPAGPGYRVEKEIKNVVTVIAKTCHYWNDHMPATQRRSIATLLERLNTVSPLIQPSVPGIRDQRQDYQALSSEISRKVETEIGLTRSAASYVGWVGVRCPNVRAAIWMMRLVIASNCLSRREGEAIFLPVDLMTDPNGELIVARMVQSYSFAAAKDIV